MVSSRYMRHQATSLTVDVDAVVANAVIVLKLLVQVNLQQQTAISEAYSPVAIISRLAYRIDEIHHPKARACILWLVGQYAATTPSTSVGLQNGGPDGIVEWAPDVLRKSAISFMQEVCPLLPIPKPELSDVWLDINRKVANFDTGRETPRTMPIRSYPSSLEQIYPFLSSIRS